MLNLNKCTKTKP